ncbi:AsnC family protein [Herbaspirillum sp. DW155]|uniref:hypothetical protein n=1 Tax=Herbaspirillum sp. DW155 TaxID=3095609 RepID=UPI00308FB4B9|nr:AsnC family protein [Herbaspirillum sp. DW155]
MDIVEHALAMHGPCVSTTLVATLVEKYGVTAVNARQKVSRNKTIKKLAYVKFPRNAQFIYFQKDYASPMFWDALIRDLLKHSISHGSALACLFARRGIMPRKHFEIACGAPLAKKGHLAPAKILEILLASKLVQLVDVPGVGQCIELGNQRLPDAIEVAKMRARLRTEEVLLGAVRDWARDLGFVSYQKVAIRDENEDGKQPRVGTFSWDLTGPSYLSPMLQWNGSAPKPGFLACDVLLGTNIREEHIRPFINKCKTLRNLKNVGRCLYFFVADGFDQKAFALARSEGIVAATTETLFGKEVAEALKKLTSLLTDLYPSAAGLERLDEIFTNLKHIEGAALNLRGALFEYLVAEYVRTNEASTEISMNQVVRDEMDAKAEVDVLVTHYKKPMRFIECKGYKPGGTVSDNDVERWLNDRIPLIRRVAAAHPDWRDVDQISELWTTGKLSERAQAMFAAKQDEVRKFKLVLVSGEELAERISQSGNTSLKKTFRQHFFDHPLEKIDKAIEKRKRRTSIPETAWPTRREADELA